MKSSSLYKNLGIRKKQLLKEFLNFPNADSVIPKNQDKLRAFRLLMHAEIEFFLEESVRALLCFIESEWVTYKRYYPALKYLILYSDSRFDAKSYIKPEDRIKDIIKSFKTLIDNKNHGIKQKNIISLVVPLGVRNKQLDVAWLSTMDGYGELRGKYAHKSYSSVTVIIDKNTEINELRNVLNGLKKLDSRLQELRSPKIKFIY